MEDLVVGKEFKDLEIRWTYYYKFAILSNGRLREDNYRVQSLARLHSRTMSQERKKQNIS